MTFEPISSLAEAAGTGAPKTGLLCGFSHEAWPNLHADRTKGTNPCSTWGYRLVCSGFVCFALHLLRCQLHKHRTCVVHGRVPSPADGSWHTAGTHRWWRKEEKRQNEIHCFGGVPNDNLYDPKQRIAFSNIYSSFIGQALVMSTYYVLWVKHYPRLLIHSITHFIYSEYYLPPRVESSWIPSLIQDKVP